MDRSLREQIENLRQEGREVNKVRIRIGNRQTWEPPEEAPYYYR